MLWTGSIPPSHIPYTGQGTVDSWTLLSRKINLEKLTRTHMVKKALIFTQPRGSFPCSQKPAILTVFTKYFPRTKAYPALRL
jgi:hypothetical protein